MLARTNDGDVRVRYRSLGEVPELGNTTERSDASRVHKDIEGFKCAAFYGLPFRIMTASSSEVDATTSNALLIQDTDAPTVHVCRADSPLEVAGEVTQRC